MAKIFISYRRDDSAYATGVIRDQLASNLRDCEIFLDVDSIPYGVDFRRHLESSVGACDYLIAVIGKRWLSVVDTRGQRRLDDPNDAVRVEVETALRREIPLIPVFLDGMMVPTPEELPDSIRDLVSRNAIFVRPPPDFNNDIARLVQSFREHLKQHQPVLDPLPLTTPPVHQRSRSPRGWLAGIGVLSLVLLAAIGWYFSRPVAGLPDFEIDEHYLYTDSLEDVAPWQPHPRAKEKRFKSPVNYLHWVIVVKYPKHVRRTIIPMSAELFDENGTKIVSQRGISDEIPDEVYPLGGKTEWSMSLSWPGPTWKPGKYSLQLDVPGRDSIRTDFEILPE